MVKKNKYQDLAPDDLKGHFMLAEPNKEFIVSIDFTYLSIYNYNGYKIVSCETLGALSDGLEGDEEIGTPPHWFPTFPMEMLRGAFKIHSYDPGDVDAMRALFGDQVGEVSYIEVVEQHSRDYWHDKAPVHVDEYYAKLIALTGGNFDTGAISTIDENAIKYFEYWPETEYLNLPCIEELSSKAAESLSKHKSTLELGIKKLSSESAAELAKHTGNLVLYGLETITDGAAEAFLQHEGNLDFDLLSNLTKKSAEFLSKKKGTIDGIDPADWVAKFLEDNPILPN